MEDQSMKHRYFILTILLLTRGNWLIKKNCTHLLHKRTYRPYRTECKGGVLVKMQATIPQSFVLIFTIGLLLTLGVLGNLKDGYADAGGTRETATYIELDTEYSEAIDAADVDYFSIVVGQSGKLTVWTTGDIDPMGWLQTVDGTTLVRNDDISRFNVNFSVASDVTAGTYYVRVQEASGLTGTYVIQATFKPNIKEVGNTPATAAPLVAGAPYSENIDSSDDVDYFGILVSQSGTLAVWTEGDLDTLGQLQDSSGTDIAINDDDGLKENFTIFHNVEPGTYYLKITAFAGATGAYTVTGTLDVGSSIVDVGNTRATATPLALGTDFRAYMTPLDDVDYFRIVAEQAGTLTIQADSELDTAGELQSEDGEFLKDNDDWNAEYDFRIVHNVQPGTYYLKVTVWLGTGHYAVRATLDAGTFIVDAGGTPETATPLVLGTPYSEDIDPLDDIDYYRIVVEQAGRLTVWTTGELDTEGELQTDDGTVLGRSDDISDEDHNFRITYDAEPGTYYVKVIEYNEEAGSYIVTATFTANQVVRRDVGGTRETATLLTLGTPYPENYKYS